MRALREGVVGVGAAADATTVALRDGAADGLPLATPHEQTRWRKQTTPAVGAGWRTAWRIGGGGGGRGDGGCGAVAAAAAAAAASGLGRRPRFELANAEQAEIASVGLAARPDRPGVRVGVPVAGTLVRVLVPRPDRDDAPRPGRRPGDADAASGTRTPRPGTRTRRPGTRTRRPRPSASASRPDAGTAPGRLPRAVPPEYKVGRGVLEFLEY